METEYGMRYFYAKITEYEKRILQRLCKTLFVSVLNSSLNTDWSDDRDRVNVLKQTKFIYSYPLPFSTWLAGCKLVPTPASDLQEINMKAR